MKERSKTPETLDERAFLAEYDASHYPHPSVTTDVALVTVGAEHLRAVLIKRTRHPHLGEWGLPGGFVAMDQSLDEAANAVLTKKVGISGIFLEQLYTFGNPSRDPRTRVLTVAYYALVDEAKLMSDQRMNGGVTLAKLHVPWKGERGGPVRALDEQGNELPLAFDHAEILGMVVQRLRGKLDYAAIGFELLPRNFTLRRLQMIHETILGRPLNKDSFRRRMLASDLIVATGKHEADVGHRPAALYRFKRKRSG